MSQNVELLKQLLFEPETRALADIERRIEVVAELDARGRDALGREIEAIYARVGNDEKLSQSVAEILSESLRKAEVANHSELSLAIAPLVVSTIKAELRNSQDEMVEALYPITGRLVKSYVASAVKDLTNEINRRIEQNAVMLRLTSIATGRSVAELALAGTQDLELRELLLIRRGTGELIARWPDQPAGSRDHAMSGILAAINEFAGEAFAADDSSLRQIDLGDEEVYLRASPLYLLAARCKGSASQNIEQLIDETFLDAVERQHDAADSGQDIHRGAGSALADLGSDLRNRIEQQKSRHSSRAGIALLKFLAALILLPLLGWIGFGYYSRWSEDRVRATAQSVIENVSDMKGYPVGFDVSPRGTMLVVSGLAPSASVKSEVAAKLSVALKRTTLVDHLAVVPGSGGGPDLSPEVKRINDELQRLERGIEITAARRACDRAMFSLQKAEEDLEIVLGKVNGAQQAAFEKARDTAKAATAKVRDLRRELVDGSATFQIVASARDVMALVHEIDAASSSLLASTIETGVASSPRESTAPQSGDPPIGFAAQSLAAAADRLQAVVGATAIAALKPVPAPPPAPAAVVDEPTPIQKLRDWTAANAVFFADDVNYRSPDAASAALSELASLAKTAGVLIRVVGYTDEAGGQQRNVPLAEQRARRVVDDLVALGIDQGQLVAVGRADSRDLSKSQGAESPNRRVEFEIGFNGETSP